MGSTAGVPVQPKTAVNVPRGQMMGMDRQAVLWQMFLGVGIPGWNLCAQVPVFRFSLLQHFGGLRFRNKNR